MYFHAICVHASSDFRVRIRFLPRSRPWFQSVLGSIVRVGVYCIERNFEPMQRQVESWRQTQITDAQAKPIFYSAFMDETRRAEDPDARDAPHVHVQP